jgi:outer membrane lipoprotein-sorting protein
MKQWFFMLILPILLVIPGYSQEIITADAYLKAVSERYGSIKDYEAHIVIRSGSSEMVGNVSFLSPSFLRIDFTKPSDQVIVFNGELLTVYLPEYRAVLNQSITPSRRPSATGASMASAQGLALLTRNYVSSFITGPNPVALDANSSEQVIKLRLIRRNTSENFREIILSINPANKTIRRIEGRTVADTLVQFDFTNIRTNQGIPEMRFSYDSPASANMYNNFLFKDTD